MPQGIIPVLAIASILAAALPAPAQTTKHPPIEILPKADLFKTASAAQTACPQDTIVWSALGKGKSFHLASSRYYGKTHHGAYVCEKAALAAGYHQAKS